MKSGHNQVLQAMEDATYDLTAIGTGYLDMFQQSGMPERMALAAIIQSAIAALVALEVIRLKTLIPVTDVSKLAEDVDHIRAKTR